MGFVPHEHPGAAGFPGTLGCVSAWNHCHFTVSLCQVQPMCHPQLLTPGLTARPSESGLENMDFSQFKS